MTTCAEMLAVALRRLPLLAVLALQLPLATDGVLLGVDLGSQYFKAAIAAPGKPFNTVHNQHSKRKTPTMVSFHEKVRTFGDDAVGSASKGLPKTPMLFTHELGRNFTGVSSDDISWLPKMFYPYRLDVNSSGSLRFKFDEDGDGVTVEEATAHVLSFAKFLSEQDSGGVISETILTVPAHATMQQRLAILDAAELARLPRAALMHETSAAALQRALGLDLSGSSPTDKKEEDNSTEKSAENETTSAENETANETTAAEPAAPKTSTVMYYNMGSRHVEVCIVAYRGATYLSKPTVAMDVLGCGFTRDAGGHHVDMIIADKMREAFGQKYPKLAEGLSTSVRALKKLEKEANAVKHVLSANKDAQFRVESLYEDTDFAHPISRETLESWCASLFSDAIAQPIEDALKAAGVSLEDVDTVEMIGGGWRIPKVQSLLSEYLQTHRPEGSPTLSLSQHLNGEEAMATGAAFMGANTSTSFKTKKIYFTDVSPHRYSLVLSPLNASQLNASQEGWSRDVALWPAYSKLKSKMTVKLHQDFDISAALFENGNHIVTWELTGVHEATTVTYPSLNTPLISLKFELDESGVVQMASMQAIFDENVTVMLPPPKAAGKNLTNESATSNDTKADAKPEAEQGSNESSQAEETPEASSESTSEVKADNATNATVGKVTTKLVKRKVQLKRVDNYEGVLPRPLSAEEKLGALARLDAMNEADAEVQRTNAARNALETFIYESRDKITSDEGCLKVSTEEEREEIGSLLMNAEDWFYEDEATNGNASVFEAKLASLDEKVSPIKARAYELEERALLPDLVEKVTTWVNSTLTYVQKNMTWVKATEIEGVKNLTIIFDAWYENVTQLQSSKALTETPAYTSYDVKVRLERMRSEAHRLTKIIKIDPQPYDRGYGGYGGYGGGYGGYGGYDYEKMREYYRRMYEQNGTNGTNYSDWARNFGGNYSDFFRGGAGFNDSEYMRSFYEHAAKNFSKEEASGSDSGAGEDKAKSDTTGSEQEKAEKTEL